MGGADGSRLRAHGRNDAGSEAGRASAGRLGTLTLATPALVRKYALPTIKTITRMCKEAGIPSMLHSCGRSMAFLEMLYNETDLDCINPLEEPPMGDVDLAEVKRLYGDQALPDGQPEHHERAD